MALILRARNCREG